MSFLWDVASPFTVLALFFTAFAHTLGVIAFVFGRRLGSRAGRITIGVSAIAFALFSGANAALGGVSAIVRANRAADFVEPELHDAMLEAGQNEAWPFVALTLVVSVLPIVLGVLGMRHSPKPLPPDRREGQS